MEKKVETSIFNLAKELELNPLEIVNYLSKKTVSKYKPVLEDVKSKIKELNIVKSLFEGELSPDITKLILMNKEVKEVKAACSTNKYMKKLCDDRFWLQYYQIQFLGPKYYELNEDQLEKIEKKITDLFFYLLKNEKEKYTIAIYKKYKPYIDVARNKNEAIRLASKNGQVEVVKELLKDSRVNPAATNNYAIQLASEYGHADVVKLLLADKRVNPAVYENYAIQLASEYGHADVVKLLLADKRVNPAAYDNEAIKLASENGHTGVVKLLLADKIVDQRPGGRRPADPAADDNFAIKRASEYGHVDVVKLLLGDPRVRNSLSKAELKKYQSY